MDAVTNSECSEEELLRELAASLACTNAFRKTWTLPELLEEVTVMYNVAVEMEALHVLNPFVSSDTISADA